MLNEIENISQRERIINAAFKCISSKGYANISLRDIADEAGVVLSQLNYYYKNKEGLFTEVIKVLSKKYLTEIEEELRKGSLAKERLKYIIDYFKKILLEQPELFKLLFDITGMALWSSVFTKLLQNMYTNLSKLIEKYIINDDFYKKYKDKYSSKALSRMILGTLVGTAIQIVLNPEEDCTDSLNVIEAIF
jgi:AcrR family transcriptional regulator